MKEESLYYILLWVSCRSLRWSSHTHSQKSFPPNTLLIWVLTLPRLRQPLCLSPRRNDTFLFVPGLTSDLPSFSIRNNFPIWNSTLWPPQTFSQFIHYERQCVTSFVPLTSLGPMLIRCRCVVTPLLTPFIFLTTTYLLRTMSKIRLSILGVTYLIRYRVTISFSV